MADPARSLDRARETWKNAAAEMGTAAHDRAGPANKLTDYWQEHDIKQGDEYAILTNIIHQEWAEVDVKAHKTLKGLKTQNLRDHMSEAELIFTALAELSTRQLPRAPKPDKREQGGRENRRCYAKKRAWNWKARRARRW